MIIGVKVKPGTKAPSRLEQVGERDYVAHLHARAKDGEANAELIKLLSDYFRVAKTSIKIKTGTTARNKTIEIPEFNNRQ